MTHSRLIGAAVLMLLVAIIASTYYSDHQSCLRTQTTRAGLRVFFIDQAARAQQRATVDVGLKRQLDLQAQRAASRAALVDRRLDCSGATPGT